MKCEACNVEISHRKRYKFEDGKGAGMEETLCNECLGVSYDCFRSSQEGNNEGDVMHYFYNTHDDMDAIMEDLLR